MWSRTTQQLVRENSTRNDRPPRPVDAVVARAMATSSGARMLQRRIPPPFGLRVAEERRLPSEGKVFLGHREGRPRAYRHCARHHRRRGSRISRALRGMLGHDSRQPPYRWLALRPRPGRSRASSADSGELVRRIAPLGGFA